MRLFSVHIHAGEEHIDEGGHKGGLDFEGRGSLTFHFIYSLKNWEELKLGNTK